jgi:hypothetical protein
MPRIGYHGTSKRHRQSLQQGLRRVESEWDPASGGELGQGFYVANNPQGAQLYAYGVCAAAIERGTGVADDHTIDLWQVHCKLTLEWFVHFSVSAQQTWAKFPKAYFENFHFVYLYNDPGLPAPLVPSRAAMSGELPLITQLKSNPNVFPLGMLTLEFEREMPLEEAFG